MTDGNKNGPFRKVAATLSFETWTAREFVRHYCDLCGFPISPGAQYVGVQALDLPEGFQVGTGFISRQHGDNYDACPKDN